MTEPFRFTIRTPQGTPFDGAVVSARVPTETGLVGLRPRGEAIALAVEAGLVVLRTADGDQFAATAGGLLDGRPDHTTLMTPLAVVGSSEDEMLAALQEMFTTPGGELLARRQLQELEQRILREVHGRPIPFAERGLDAES